MWEAKSAGSVLGRQQDREEVRQARHPRVQSVRKCPSSGPLSAPPPEILHPRHLACPSRVPAAGTGLSASTSH